MKAYEDLTPRGKLRRTGLIARAALEDYGITEARLRLMVDAGNTTYRVKTVGHTPVEGSLYVDGCYSLRLHQPGYQNEGAVDFDDGGYGYWVYDLAVPLVDLEGDNAVPTYRDALLEGYSEIRSIPEEQLEKLELFQAAFRALEIFWGTACTLRNPDSTYWKERRENAWTHIKRYLKENPLR